MTYLHYFIQVLRNMDSHSNILSSLCVTLSVVTRQASDELRCEAVETRARKNVIALHLISSNPVKLIQTHSNVIQSVKIGT